MSGSIFSNNAVTAEQIGQLTSTIETTRWRAMYNDPQTDKIQLIYIVYQSDRHRDLIVEFLTLMDVPATIESEGWIANLANRAWTGARNLQTTLASCPKQPLVIADLVNYIAYNEALESYTTQNSRMITDVLPTPEHVPGSNRDFYYIMGKLALGDKKYLDQPFIIQWLNNHPNEKAQYTRALAQWYNNSFSPVSIAYYPNRYSLTDDETKLMPKARALQALGVKFPDNTTPSPSIFQSPVLQNPVMQSPVMQSPVMQSPVPQSPFVQQPGQLWYSQPAPYYPQNPQPQPIISPYYNQPAQPTQPIISPYYNQPLAPFPTNKQMVNTQPVYNLPFANSKPFVPPNQSYAPTNQSYASQPNRPYAPTNRVYAPQPSKIPVPAGKITTGPFANIKFV